MLITVPKQIGDFSESEVLVPALALLGLPGVRRMQRRRSKRYVHFMLERHEILLAGAAAIESFYPGATALKMLAASKRSEVLALFPPEGFGETARAVLTRRQGEALMSAIRQSFGKSALKNRRTTTSLVVLKSQLSA